MSWLIEKIIAPIAPWLIAALLISNAGLGAAFWWRGTVIERERAKTVQALANFATCKANTTTLETSLAAQNQAVEALKTEATAQAERLKQAQAQANKWINKANAAALAIAELKLTGNCEQDMSILSGSIK
jgi:uncharacterized coiled-coil protein SlyX